MCACFGMPDKIERIMKKILLIEDDEQIVELMDIHLKDIFCKSTWAFRGEHDADHDAYCPFGRNR